MGYGWIASSSKGERKQERGGKGRVAHQGGSPGVQSFVVLFSPPFVASAMDCVQYKRNRSYL